MIADLIAVPHLFCLDIFLPETKCLMRLPVVALILKPLPFALIDRHKLQRSQFALTLNPVLSLSVAQTQLLPWCRFVQIKYGQLLP